MLYDSIDYILLLEKSDELISCRRKKIIVDEKTVEIVKPVLIENGVVKFVNVYLILVHVKFLLCPAGNESIFIVICEP